MGRSQLQVIKKREQEPREIPRAERGAGKDVGAIGVSDTSGDRSNRDYNSQAWRVAPINHRSKI